MDRLLASRPEASLRSAAALLVLVVVQSLTDPVYIAPAVIGPLAMLALARLARQRSRASAVSFLGVLVSSVLLLLPVYAKYRSVRAENPLIEQQSLWGSSQLLLAFTPPVRFTWEGLVGNGTTDASWVTPGRHRGGSAVLRASPPGRHPGGRRLGSGRALDHGGHSRLHAGSRLVWQCTDAAAALRHGGALDTRAVRGGPRAHALRRTAGLTSVLVRLWAFQAAERAVWLGLAARGGREDLRLVAQDGRELLFAVTP